MTDGEHELACLRKDLEAFYKAAQQASLAAALAESRGGEDFEADLACLRALQETLERNDEQS